MKTRLLAPIAAAATAFALAACGGNDDPGPPPATSVVPASANQSVDGWIDYLKRLVASAADTLEPVDTSAVTRPTRETTEPSVVD